MTLLEALKSSMGELNTSEIDNTFYTNQLSLRGLDALKEYDYETDYTQLMITKKHCLWALASNFDMMVDIRKGDVSKKYSKQALLDLAGVLDRRFPEIRIGKK